MKVCFIAPKAYQLFNSKVKSVFGGTEVQLYLLSKELAKNKNLDVNFMVADYGQEKLEEYNKVKVWKSLNFEKNFLNRVLNFLRKFNEINADVYIQRSLSPLSGIIAIYAKIKGKKFIYMIANDGEINRTHEAFNTKIKFFFTNLVFKYSNIIVTQNKYQNENIRLRGMKSILINSSCSIPNNIIKKRNYILWVGRSDILKRAGLFLKLARLNKDKQFIIICPPSTKNPEISIQIQKNSKKMKNFKFIEFVPFHDIDKYFEKAKVFVNTSSQEGFPSTFVQATKNKTPILSLNVNPNNFITKYNCGFYCDDNFKKLNDNLNILLDDKKLYGRMSENAFRYARESHDIKKNATRFLEVITK